MSLGPHLLHAMVAAGGDAVVIHTGDLPYVATGSAEAEIGNEPLASSDVDAVLEQLLPAASLRTFTRVGAIRYECPPLPDYPGQRFTVVAVREADELWVEIRRDGSGARGPSVDLVETIDPVETEAAHGRDVPAPASAPPIVVVDDESEDPLALPPFDELWPNQVRTPTVHSSPSAEIDLNHGLRPGGPGPARRTEQDRRAPPGTTEDRPIADDSIWSGPSELDLQALDGSLSLAPFPSSGEPATPPHPSAAARLDEVPWD